MGFIARKIDQTRGQAALNRGHAPRPRVVGEAERLPLSYDVFDVMGYGAKLAIRATRTASRMPKQGAELAIRSARAAAELPGKAGRSVVDTANGLMHVSVEELRKGHRLHELKVFKETAAKATSELDRVDPSLDRWGTDLARSIQAANVTAVKVVSELDGEHPGLDEEVGADLAHEQVALGLTRLDRLLHGDRQMRTMKQAAIVNTLELAGAERVDRDPDLTSDLRKELIAEAPAREHGVLAGDILNEFLSNGTDVTDLPIDLRTVPSLLARTVPQLGEAPREPPKDPPKQPMQIPQPRGPVEGS